MGSVLIKKKQRLGGTTKKKTGTEVESPVAENQKHKISQ